MSWKPALALNRNDCRLGIESININCFREIKDNWEKDNDIEYASKLGESYDYEYSWDNMNKEINDILENSIKLEERKRYGEHFHSKFIKQDIDVALPKLFRKMDAQIYLNNLGKNKKDMPQDLSFVYLTELIQQSKTEIDRKWELHMRSDSYDKINDAIDFMFKCQTFKFYPAQFCSLVEFGDNFCSRILDRARTFSRIENTSDDAWDDDTNLCVNWLLKICSEPTFLARLFCIITFLPIRKYLSIVDKDEIRQIAGQIRGTSNILYSSYLRAYLVYMTKNQFPEYLEWISRVCLDDLTMNFVDAAWFNAISKIDRTLSQSDFCNLIAPALKYVMYFALNRCNSKTIDELMMRLKNLNSPSIVEAVVSCIPPLEVNSRFLEFFAIVSELENKKYPIATILSALGKSLCRVPKKYHLPCLAKAWEMCKNCKNLEDYFICAPPWIQYSAGSETNNILDALLENFYKRVSSDISLCYLHSHTISHILLIVSKKKNFKEFLSLKNVLPLLLCIHKQEELIRCCNNIFLYLLKTNGSEVFSDKGDMNKIIEIFGVCNKNYGDSLQDMSTLKVESHIVLLIERFSLPVLSYDMIDFLSNIRGNVDHLDNVLPILPQIVLIQILNHKDNIDTDIVNMGLCFCMVTLPAIVASSVGLNMTLLCGYVALSHEYISQAYAFFDLIVSEFEYLKENTMTNLSLSQLAERVTRFIQLTNIIPDHPTKEIMHYLKRIIDFIIYLNQLDVDGLYKSELLCTALEYLSIKLSILSQNTKDHLNLLVPIDEYLEKGNKYGEFIINQINDFLLDPNNSYDQSRKEKIYYRIKMCSDMEDSESYNLLHSLANVTIC